MRVDAKVQIKREVQVLLELQINKLVNTGGLIVDLVKLEAYRDLVNNTLLTISALKYIKKQTLKQTPLST